MKKIFFAAVFCSALLLPLTFTLCQGNISFVKSQQDLGTCIGRNVRLIDIDNDKDLDILTRNGNENGDTSFISFWYNDGKGHFKKGPQQIKIDDYTILNITSCDISPDNFPDLFVTTTGPSLIFINNGTGFFSLDSRKIMDGGYNANLADLDGDSDVDIFMLYMANYMDLNDTIKKTIKIWLNDGNGNFSENGSMIGGGVMVNCWLGDIDGNGSVDAVTSGWYIKDDITTPNPNKIWLNDGEGNFTGCDKNFYTENHHVHDLAIQDIDNDNDPDLIMAITSENNSRILINQGNCNFIEKQKLNYGWFDKVRPADIDNDGDIDIVGANGGYSNLPNTIWINDSKGNFTDSGLRMGNDWTWDCATGDIDNDGDTDIIYAGFLFNNNQLNPYPYTILLNNTISNE